MDSIEKMEELKGLCNVILLTSETTTKSRGDHSPAQLRSLKTELERKREVIEKKVKDIEQLQEANRKELAVIISTNRSFIQLFRKFLKKKSI